MIDEIIKRFDAKRDELLKGFSKSHVQSYKALVETVVRAVTSEGEYGDCNLDPENITEIGGGNYSGNFVYVIASKGYQPDEYWYTKVHYGSCSGCDTLQGIHEYSSDPPTPEQAQGYLTLALHLVQNMKAM